MKYLTSTRNSVYIIDIDRPYKDEARLIYPMDKGSKVRLVLE